MGRHTDRVNAAATRSSLLAGVSLVAGLISYLLIAHGDRSDSAGVLASALALPTGCALALAVRSLRRGDAGSALAWESSALALVVFLMLLGLPAIHIANLFPDPNCDPVMMDCSRVVVAPTFLPFLSFLCCGAGIIGMLRASRAAERAEGR